MFLLIQLTLLPLLLIELAPQFAVTCQKIPYQNFNFPYQHQRQMNLQQQQQQNYQQQQANLNSNYHSNPFNANQLSPSQRQALEHLVRSNLHNHQHHQHHLQNQYHYQAAQNYAALPQAAADRRASQPAHQQAGDQHRQHDHSADNNQGKLLVCYYTSRQTAPYWPKDARQFVVSPETLNALSETSNSLTPSPTTTTQTTINYDGEQQQQHNSLARSMSASSALPSLAQQIDSAQQVADNYNELQLNRKSQPQVLKMHTDLQQQQQLLFGSSSSPSLSFNNLFAPTSGQKPGGQTNSNSNNINLNRNKNKQHQDALILQALATDQLNSMVATSTPALVVAASDAAAAASSSSLAGGPVGRQSVAYSIVGADGQEMINTSIGNGGSGNNGKSLATVAAISQNNGLADHPVGPTTSSSLAAANKPQVVFSTPSLVLGRSTFVSTPATAQPGQLTMSNANNELQLDTKSHLFIPASQANFGGSPQQHNNYYHRREAAATTVSLPQYQQQQQQHQKQQQQVAASVSSPAISAFNSLSQQQVGVQKGKSLQVASGEQQVSSTGTSNGLIMSSGGGNGATQSNGLLQFPSQHQLSLIGQQDSHLLQQQQQQQPHTSLPHDFQPQYSQNHHQLLVTQQQQQQQSLPQKTPTITTLTSPANQPTVASASYPTVGGNLLTTTPARVYQQQQHGYSAYPSSSANAAAELANAANSPLPLAASRAATTAAGHLAQGDKSNQERAYHEHQHAAQSSQQQQAQQQQQQDGSSSSSMQTHLDVQSPLASLPVASSSTTQLSALSPLDHQTGSAQQAASTLSSALVSSPLSTMFDVFGAASQYLMRFKPTSLISPSAFASLNGMQVGASSGQEQHSHLRLPASQLAQQPPASSSNSSSFIPLPFGSNFFSNMHKAASGSPEDKSSSSGAPTGGRGFLARLTGGGQTIQRREEVCGRTIQTPERRIIGGEGARYGEFPYQVHIKIAKHQCGGALVDRQSIVTAAHCVYHFITRAPVSKLQIVIGAYDIEDEQYQELPPQYFKVNKVKLHPNFRFSASHPDRYDIAILKLDKPVKYTDNVLPVCLPSKDLKFESSIGTVTGFGKTDPSLSNRYGTRLLQKVDVPIIENQECERWHRTRGIDLKIFPEMMCAGYEDGLKDACVGDSGGPLVVKTPTGPNGAFRWTLAGITSAGFGCAQSRQPGIYHRVSHTVDWILDNLD